MILHKPKHFRKFDDLVKDPAVIYYMGIVDVPGTENRNKAIINVLLRLPEHDYRELREKIKNFAWIIPSYDCYGEIIHLHLPELREQCIPGGIKDQYVRVIFLSPALEEENLAIAIAAVAYRLAYVVLGFGSRVDLEADEIQRNAAWTKALEWGFGRELKKYLKKKCIELPYPD